MSEGVIYILINDAMPGYVKIGKTGNAVEDRMKSLDTTGVPLPFECFYAARVANMDFAEKQLHDAFGDQRVRSKREFFEIDPARVAAALKLAELEDVTPRDDVVETTDDKRALEVARGKRSSFNMEMIGVKPGATLVFSKGEDVTAKVLDRHEIEFEGERMSLTKSALIIVKRLGYTWDKIAGPQYWMYEDETLYRRMKRLESE
jgi:hypothetical protein